MLGLLSLLGIGELVKNCIENILQSGKIGSNVN